MKEKTLWDYADPVPPLSVQLSNTAGILIVLKLAGELQYIDWGIIVILSVVGVAARVGKALFRKWDSEPSTATSKDA